MAPIDPPESYPSSLDREEVLADGTRIRIRPVVPVDIERLRHAFAVADSETIRRRFLTGAPPSGEGFIHYLIDIDYRTRLALLAMDGEGNSIGVARYEAVEGSTLAEIAIVVTPEWRKRGVGNILVEALEAPAREAGFVRFEALYASDNRGISILLERLGYGDRRFEDGLMCVSKLLS